VLSLAGLKQIIPDQGLQIGVYRPKIEVGLIDDLGLVGSIYADLQYFGEYLMLASLHDSPPGVLHLRRSARL
jgi:hypothetical protein